MSSMRCPTCSGAVPIALDTDATICPACGTQLRATALKPDAVGADRQTKYLTKALNVAGFVLMLWAILFPLPYVVVILACLLLPLIAVATLATSHGRVNLNSQKRSKQPHVALAFLGPCIALCLRALFDVQLVSYKAAILPCLAVGLPFAALAFWYAPDLRRKPVTGLLILPFALCYGYGASIEANCLLDTSKPTEFETTIVNKRVSYGSRGSKYYYLDVLPWGPFSNAPAIHVSHLKYNTYTQNQTITMRLKKGALGAQWFYIASKKR